MEKRQNKGGKGYYRYKIFLQTAHVNIISILNLRTSCFYTDVCPFENLAVRKKIIRMEILTKYISAALI